jgi:uncharacterized membrane protein
METSPNDGTPYPNLPPILESDDREYRDPGVPSTVSIAGHPLHPLTVIFPIAFLAGALVTDLVYLFVGDSFWARASFWLIAAGLLTGILAAIVGMSDFLKIERVRKRSAGWMHLVLNVTLLVLTVINLSLRWGNPIDAVVPWGLLISLIVGTLASLSGWFGAELSYRHKIGVVGPGSRTYP